MVKTNPKYFSQIIFSRTQTGGWVHPGEFASAGLYQYVLKFLYNRLSTHLVMMFFAVSNF